MPVTELRGVGADVSESELSVALRDKINNPLVLNSIARQATTNAANVTVTGIRTLISEIADVPTTEGQIIIVTGMATLDKGTTAGNSLIELRDAVTAGSIDFTVSGPIATSKFPNAPANLPWEANLIATGVVTASGTASFRLSGFSDGSDSIVAQQSSFLELIIIGN